MTQYDAIHAIQDGKAVLWLTAYFLPSVSEAELREITEAARAFVSTTVSVAGPSRHPQGWYVGFTFDVEHTPAERKRVESWLRSRLDLRSLTVEARS